MTGTSTFRRAFAVRERDIAYTVSGVLECVKKV